MIISLNNFIQRGTDEDMDPSSRKRVVLTNISSILFSLTVFLLAILFAYLESNEATTYCIAFAIFMLSGIFLNYFSLNVLAPIAQLMVSNIGGIWICATVGKSSLLQQGYFVLIGAPWILFPLHKKKTIFLLSLLPISCYMLLHFGYFDFIPLAIESLNATELIRGISSGIFMLLNSFLFFYLSSEHTKAENLAKEYRAQSFQSSKLASLGEMAGGIAHEINNPLAVLSTSLLILNSSYKKGKLNENIFDNIIEKMDRTIKRVSKIIDGLKRVTRYDGEAIEKSMTKTEDLLEDVIGLCGEKFQQAGIRLQTKFDEFSPEYIYCDRVQISQVLLNLLGNAYDAIENLEKEKWVEIKLIQEKDEVIIMICDCGDKVSEKIQEKMFQPFFTSKPVGKGTGLGLSISKSIIEMHKGTLSIDNNSPNTCFIITLPNN